MTLLFIEITMHRMFKDKTSNSLAATCKVYQAKTSFARQ